MCFMSRPGKVRTDAQRGGTVNVNMFIPIQIPVRYHDWFMTEKKRKMADFFMHILIIGYK
jgi:hypothetical protein